MTEMENEREQETNSNNGFIKSMLTHLSVSAISITSNDSLLAMSKCQAVYWMHFGCGFDGMPHIQLNHTNIQIEWLTS